MHLYLATDSKMKSDNRWFVGVSKSSSPDKVKEELGLDKGSGNVDFVIESPQAKEIIAYLRKKINHTFIRKHIVLVEGDHGCLAQILIQITRDYEADHPSFRRSVTRWLKSVNS
jgi:hypothetical protein